MSKARFDSILLLLLAGFSALSLAIPVHAGVTVTQNVSPGATNWPPTPVLNTMANPFSSATVPESFTNAGVTRLAQTFTITTTNYTLQRISIYAGGGTGTGAGTNLTLRLFDLGFQTAPQPAPYGGVTPNETISANLFGSGAGLSITYTNQANGVLQFDFTGSDQAVLVMGHMYVFEIGGGPDQQPMNWFGRTSSSTYSGGAAYTNRYWLNGNSTCELALAVYGTPVTNPVPPAPFTGVCTVNWTNVRQRIDGFGASSAWRPSLTTGQADMLFSTNTGIGLSLLRSRIRPPDGGSDETSIMVQARDRGARIWSSPWTPPITYKGTNANLVFSLNGGDYLGGGATNQAYANYLASYVVKMNAAGFNIYAISIQNEPDVDTTGYESCQWTGAQIHDFVPYLAAALVASNVASTKILLPESQHWSSNPTLYTTTMNDPTVATNVDIIADHNYDGINADNTATSAPSQINSAYPNTSLWETEVSALKGSYSSMYNGVYWAGRIHSYMTVAQANAWHHWWLISGNTTPNQGLFDIAISPAKRMYTIGNFSRFVRPNFFRVGVVTNSGAALVSAYKQPNSGAFAIVAINTHSNTPINLTVNLTNLTGGSVTTVTPWVTSTALSLSSQTAVVVSNFSFTYTIPGPGVVTFVGQGLPTNSPPTDISLSSASIPENRPAGSTVGSFSSTDPDGGTFTYSLIGGAGSTDNASFTISNATLQAAASFNYEVKNSYSIRVRTTDQFDAVFEKIFAITVTDTNEAPTDISLSSSSVAENQPSGTTVGTLASTDPDAVNTFTYTFVSGAGSADNASFSISGSSLDTAVAFDYEAGNSRSVRIRSTDQGGLFTEKAFAIGITDLNEAPALAPINDQFINVGVTFQLTNTATDPDLPPQTLTYSLLSVPPNNAALDGASGILTWRPLVSQALTTNVITVQVVDNGVPPMSATNSYILTVNSVAQPVFSSITAAPDGVTLVVDGPVGPDYTLETSTNLTDWEGLLTTNSPGIPVTLVDSNSVSSPQRFYRVRLGP